MRGAVVLLGATSAWVLVTGAHPRWRFGLLSFDPRSAALGAGIAALAFVVSQALLGVGAASIAIGALSAAVPVGVRQRKRRAAATAVRAQWPDVLLRVRSSVSAGSTLADAVIEAMSAMDNAFVEVADILRSETAVGRGFAAGAAHARAVLDDPVSDRVLVTLEAASLSGGRRVGEIVGALARSIGDELRLYAAHDAALTEQRWTANVALAAPWVLLSLTIATNPQAKAAFSTGEGSFVIATGFVATVLGWYLATRTAKLASVPRVFR